MQQSDTRYAYFHVRGSFDPAEVTRSVGIVPTETAREGEMTSMDTSSLAKAVCKIEFKLLHLLQKPAVALSERGAGLPE